MRCRQGPLTGYDRRMGRYAGPLGAAFADLLCPEPGSRVLDVGCGRGALTEPLVARLGPERVVGVDLAVDDLRACAVRAAGVALCAGDAHRLPFADAAFDRVGAQLVLGLVADAPTALAEMRRVCRPGGVVAGCVWDFGGGMTLLRAFWDSATAVDASATAADQARTQRFTTEPELAGLWRSGGLAEVTTAGLVVAATYPGWDDLWEPLAAPDGAPGRFLATLDGAARERVREGLRDRLGRPSGRFSLTARASAVVGAVPGG